MKTLIFLIATFSLSTACAKEAVTEPTLKVFKSKGSIQCEPQTGIPPETMRSELEKAGITVKSFGCGVDGLMYPAVCGGANGAINIFEIPQSKALKAASLGFRNMSELQEATETPCK
jgi:hypothetical protein